MNEAIIYIDYSRLCAIKYTEDKKHLRLFSLLIYLIVFGITGNYCEIKKPSKLKGIFQLPQISQSMTRNTYLSNLSISSGTLTPIFTSATTSYTASVGNSISTLTVTPTVDDTTSTININGTSVSSGTASNSIHLNVGVNMITIIVTAEDGTTKTYTITVTRYGSNNNDLSALATSQGTLYPVFSSTTTSYLDTLSSGTAFITVTPTASDTLATITVNGVSVISGTPSGNIPLVSGANTITMIVTAEDGTTKTYSINANVVTDYLVKISVTGLSGTLDVTNNADTLSITTNGDFTFPTTLLNGNAYSVAITSKPSSQFCAITTAPNSDLPYGTISGADVTMTIQCNTGYLYNGTVYNTFPIPTVPSLNTLTTMAGAYPISASGNTNGTGIVARFDNPIAIATDGTYIYVADIFNNAIRKVQISDNSVTTLATSTGPHGIATDGIYVYVTSYNSHIINRVPVGGGSVLTVAGSTSGNLDGQGTSAKFNTPTYLTTDGKNVYITDRGNNQIRQYSISSGAVTTIVTGLNFPNGITTDGNYLYIAESGGNDIKRYDLNLGGAATVFATGGFNTPYGLAMDGSNLYVFEGAGKTIKKVPLATPGIISTLISSVGYTDGTLGTTAQICIVANPCDSSMTTDGIYLYIADRFNNAIRKIGP